MRIILALSIISAFLTGCSGTPEYIRGDEKKKALKHIGSDVFGVYEPYLQDHKKPSVTGEPIAYRFKYRTPEQPAKFQATNAELRGRADELLDAIVDEIALEIPVDGKKRVMLYFHGGLGVPKHGTERLEAFLKNYCGSPARPVYPVFVSWRSGVGVSVKDRYLNVRNGEYVGKKGAILRLPFYLVSDLASGIAKGPETYYDVFADTMARVGIERKKESARRAEYKDEIQAGVLELQGKGDVGFLDQLREDTKEYGARLTTGRARFVTTPLIQGVGTHGWEAMRRRAEKIFATEADSQDSVDGYRTAQELGSDENTGMVSLLARRIRQLDHDLGNDRLEITVVGHSMGAIIANLLVRDFPDLPIKRIIHMASADSVRNWKSMTKPWLAKHPDVEFYNLVLHPYNEIRDDYSEKLGLRGRKIVPRGSLLIWIDQMFTTPASTDDLTSGTWYTSRKLLRHYKALPNAHLKVFARDGDPCYTATTHSNFSRMDYLNPAVYWK